MRIETLTETAPGEVIPISIDFKHLVSSIDSVIITVSVKQGVDANPIDSIVGSYQIVGTDIRQLIKAGLDGVVYLIRADITSGDLKYSGAVYLPVKELL